MTIFKSLALLTVTALLEIIGCYLPYLWLRRNGSIWLLIPATGSLLAFAYLLTLHPTASGRVYATYGGVYLLTSLVWLQTVDGIPLTRFDWIGGSIVLLGILIFTLGWQRS